jgi:divalent metal cation (Fe/Co/Zn/Cd) transporter
MTTAARDGLVRGALRLEQLSIGWMLVEGGAAIATGLLAHSVALLGFGLDSGLELVAAVALYRRLGIELRGGDAGAAEQSERKALRIVGVTLLLLAVYIALDSGRTLWMRSAPDRSTVGLGVALAALVAMPLLGRAKLRAGRALGSRALVADAKETFACAWLSASVVVGVGLHVALGWWWADPVAALAMVPFLVREGREALEEASGKGECSSCHDD